MWAGAYGYRGALHDSKSAMLYFQKAWPHT
jgi:hypothetical protein